MRILLVTHTIEENKFKRKGRWSIIPYYFEKNGNEVVHLGKGEWNKFPKVYKSFQPEIIITAGPIGCLINLFRLFLKDTPIIHDWNDNYAEILRNPLKKIVAYFLEIAAVRFSNYTVSCSKYRIRRAKRFGMKENKRIFYIPHGVEDYFLKKGKKRNLPGKNKTKILYVGEQSESKRVDKLIEEINKLPDIDLILIGKVNKEFKKNASSNIHFLGKYPKQEIPSFMISADFLVLTEDNDSALKLFEYFTARKPILAPSGRVKDSFGKFKCFLFFKDFSQIKELVKKKEKIHEKDFPKVFTWNEISKKYLDLIEKIKLKA